MSRQSIEIALNKGVCLKANLSHQHVEGVVQSAVIRQVPLQQAGSTLPKMIAVPCASTRDILLINTVGALRGG